MSTLNVNNIADEVGTGGPEFVGMPTVGGDPIVESGSNSDGEWTRWADGTQICANTGSQNVDINNSSSYGGYNVEGNDVTFPVMFISLPKLVVCAEENPVSTGSNENSLTTSSFRPFFRSIISISSTSAGYKYHAIGRWK